MMERLNRTLEQASRDAVAARAEWVRERLVAMFGDAAVERAGQRIRVRSRGIGRRWLTSTDLRFLWETLQ